MKKSILVLCSLSVMSCVSNQQVSQQDLTIYNQRSIASDVVLTDAQNHAMKLLEEDLLAASGGVRPLGKVTRLYSYFNAPKATGDSSKLWPTYLKANYQLNQYNADISWWAGAFWNPANNNTKLVNGGPGWYLAAEPVISESYGDTYYIVDFPASIKLIDVTDPTWKHVSKIKLRTQTISQLVQSGVIQKSQIGLLGMQNGYFSRLSMQNIADVSVPVYRKVVTEIFKRNDIQLVAYTWEKTGLQIICKKPVRTALVFIGQAPTDQSKMDHATVPQELLNNIAVNYTRGNLQDFEYTADKIQKVEDSKNLYSAIKSGSQKSLTPEEVSRLRALTYECE